MTCLLRTREDNPHYSCRMLCTWQRPICDHNFSSYSAGDLGRRLGPWAWKPASTEFYSFDSTLHATIFSRCMCQDLDSRYTLNCFWMSGPLFRSCALVSAEVQFRFHVACTVCGSCNPASTDRVDWIPMFRQLVLDEWALLQDPDSCVN